MKTLLIDKVKIHDTEIDFSVSCLYPKRNGVYHIFANVIKNNLIIRHKEVFLEGKRDDRVSPEKVYDKFQLAKPTYIKQILKALEDYENRSTQRTGN